MTVVMVVGMMVKVMEVAVRGGSRKLKRMGRPGTPILERAGPKTAFERSFQCFSHNFFCKSLHKRGAATPPAPPLYPRMAVVLLLMMDSNISWDVSLANLFFKDCLPTPDFV